MALLSKNDDKPAAKPAAPAGMTRKGASRAKPVRQAASSVRTVKKSGSVKGGAPLSKEEKKEQKRRERDARDRQVVASNILLKRRANYQKMRRVWWIGLGCGMACTVVAWLAMFVLPGASSDFGQPMGMAALVALVLAYVFIIGAFIFDFVKLRPMRRDVDLQVSAMTEKRMQALIDDDYAADERAREAKAKAKAKK